MTSPHADSSPVVVRGSTLRSALVLALRQDAGPMDVPQLERALARRGLQPVGRASKTISDALRWECRRGRVRRVGRSTYVIGHVARSTAWHMRQRVASALADGRATPRGEAAAPATKCRSEAER